MDKLLVWISFCLVPFRHNVKYKTQISHTRMHARTHAHTQPFNGPWSGTTPVGWYHKKHSHTHTHSDHRTSFIIFLHLQRSMASTLFIFTSLTVLSYNLSPRPLWSWTLNFILHTFLHPIIIFFSQHMPIPMQPVLLQYQCMHLLWHHLLWAVLSTRPESEVVSMTVHDTIDAEKCA